MRIQSAMKHAGYARTKRSIDIIVSIAAVILLSPIFLVIAAVIKITIGSPVLFRQNRPGMHGKPFEIYKFRTMRESKDDRGRLLRDKDRLTKTGRFLRATSLDELPELINIVRGEMSLVGPRPLLTRYLARYTPNQARRHEVKPGLTGWAQINGRNAISWEDKFDLDVWYVDNMSFRLDLKIIMITVKKVVLREGISAAGEATMPEFNPGNAMEKTG